VGCLTWFFSSVNIIMADQYTPEEIQEIFQAYDDAMQKNIPISKELAQQMQDAQKGIKNWTNEVNASFKKLGTSATDLGKSLYKGEKGAGQFGGALESATDSLSMMINLIPGIGIAAKAAAFAIKAFGKAVNIAGQQGEALHKSYKELSQVGAATAGGLQDVFVNAQKLGYGIEDLDKMVALVAANSETLAKFSLTAGDGVTAFADAMNSLRRDPSLRMLGKMPEDINAAGAAFIRQQVAVGRNQRDIGETLNKSTKSYIVELDRLQRLTGKSAEQIQKEQDEALSEDAYNQVMAELQNRADQGDKAAEAQIEKIKSVMASVSPELRKELALSIGGDVSAATKLMMSAPSLLNNVMNENKSAIETLQQAGKDLTRTATVFGPGAKVGAYDRETFGILRNAREFGKALENIEERDIAARLGQLVTDDGVKNLVDLDLAQMSSREALQSFVQLGVNPATKALSLLARASAGVTGVLPGKGAPAPATTPSSAPPGGKAPAGAPSTGAPAPSTGAGMGLTGLPIKAGATAGGAHSENLTALARNIYEKFGSDIIHFSGFKDNYARDKNSKHPAGLALDFTLKDPSKSAQIAQAIRSMGGVSYVKDEYVNPSSRATAGHIHAEVSAMMGGIATGPSSGYQAMLHGTEAIVPLPDGKKIPVDMPGFTSSLADQSSILTQQLSKLDDLVRVMQRQVEVSSKILQMTS
jgi:hypothetical protein